MALAHPDRPSLLPRRRETRWLMRVLLFATVVLLVDALFGDRGFRQTLMAEDRYEQAVRELHALRQENAALREQARLLSVDARTIEAEARRQLGLVKPGEVLFIVRTR